MCLICKEFCANVSQYSFLIGSLSYFTNIIPSLSLSMLIFFFRFSLFRKALSAPNGISPCVSPSMTHIRGFLACLASLAHFSEWKPRKPAGSSRHSGGAPWLWWVPRSVVWQGLFSWPHRVPKKSLLISYLEAKVWLPTSCELHWGRRDTGVSIFHVYFHLMVPLLGSAWRPANYRLCLPLSIE